MNYLVAFEFFKGSKNLPLGYIELFADESSAGVGLLIAVCMPAERHINPSRPNTAKPGITIEICVINDELFFFAKVANYDLGLHYFGFLFSLLHRLKYIRPSHLFFSFVGWCPLVDDSTLCYLCKAIMCYNLFAIAFCATSSYIMSYVIYI